MKQTNVVSVELGNPRRFRLVLMLLTALLLLGFVLNVGIGSVAIRPIEIPSIICNGVLCALSDLRSGADSFGDYLRASTERMILFRIRLPRLLLAMLLGGALSVSGYLLQVFFRNPIAGPFVLGISSGAKMTVGITLIFLSPLMRSVNAWTLIAAAYIGSLLITGLVLLFSRRAKNMSMLLVIGIMIGYICGAVTDFSITFANDHDVVNLTNWSMGSFSGASWEQVGMALTVCLIAVPASLLLSKPMGAYALGEGYAQSMGVPVRAVRVGIILISSLLSACVTALAGPVSFVGIAVPHIVRSLLNSSRPAFVIPAAFVGGAAFCLFCDLIARTAFAPTELSIGTVTSAFGAPVVIWMMLHRQRFKEER